jgi:serine/threonine-protein kinase
MGSRGFAADAMGMLRGSGLDAGDGTDFIQRRIALFAKIVALIAFAFDVLGLAVGSVLGHERLVDLLYAQGQIALAAATLLVASIWLLCARVRLPLTWLGMLDGLGLIGCCTAWAFFILPGSFESIHPAMMAMTLTVLARAIVVPSKAARTLRITVAALVPLLAMLWWWIGKPDPLTGEPPERVHALVVTSYQVLWAVAAITMATITSRVIYGLRQSVREAHEVGNYTLEEKLAAGGMGEVWRARHRFLARDAAVKLIRRGSRADPETLLRRFEREAHATAALRSPHTVQLYDFGQAEDGTLYYVMEMLVGVDLETLVSRYGPVPAERAIHILKQVCHSLSEAHQNGLTHRDIKPANIFVSGIGTELDFAKVLDFGLVRVQDDRPSSEQVKLTADGSTSGTPAYMAPEIVVGDESYDHRVDIYSVGCVAYWLLTGKLVFQGDTAMKMMVEHARTVPPRPQTRTELPIPPALEQIIMDCLEKDPARRPATAAELALRLGAVDVPQAWTAERAERWWRAHQPQQVQARPVAEVLLSREAAPAGRRELRPRRRQARPD